jgi:hypothetical protein
MALFLRGYPADAEAEENAAIIRVKYDVAQALAQQITASKEVRAASSSENILHPVIGGLGTALQTCQPASNLSEGIAEGKAHRLTLLHGKQSPYLGH